MGDSFDGRLRGVFRQQIAVRSFAPVIELVAGPGSQLAYGVAQEVHAANPHEEDDTHHAAEQHDIALEVARERAC